MTNEASRKIDARIADLIGWRGEMLAQLRRLIHEAEPGVIEEWKWDNPVWSHDGIICTGESYKAAIKTTFPKGAAMADPDGLFNSSMGGGTRRAIDFRQGDVVDAEAFKALIRAAVALNHAKPAKGR
jgi:hypothetical protein